ncbi:MAG: hypothetical protein Q9196_004359 [Gyalolechia fulgens]
MTALLLSAYSSLVTAQFISKLTAPPPGYQKGYATVSSHLFPPRCPSTGIYCSRTWFFYQQQDHEPLGQKSICHTNCGLPGDNHGHSEMKEGVFAAAIGPQMGGAADNCGPCGGCYSLINSGSPYCTWDDPACPVSTGPDDQKGPSEIKVMIVNHCMDCGNVEGHFDINNSPEWNNPQIWWKALDPSECR